MRHVRGFDFARPLSVGMLVFMMLPLVFLPLLSIFIFGTSKGLTLTASYAYNSVKIPATLNPFRQPGTGLITVPIPIYPVYTPEHSASGAIDFETSAGFAILRAHLDANYDSYVDAPFGKGFFVGVGLIGCFHMSGLFVQRVDCRWP